LLFGSIHFSSGGQKKRGKGKEGIREETGYGEGRGIEHLNCSWCFVKEAFGKS